MPQKRLKALAVLLLLAFLAGQVESAPHELEHGQGDAGHDGGNCTLCALAHQSTVVTDMPLLEIVLVATGETAAIELPPLGQSPLLLAFRPRSPPRLASL